MKKLCTFLLLSLLSCYVSNAQSAYWQWGRADVADVAAGNPSVTTHMATAGGNKALWAMLQNQGHNVVATIYQGRYLLTEYDNAGNAGATATIGGNVSVDDMHADAAGNWYILGEYYDTAAFPGGITLTRDPAGTSPTCFICRINSGSLTTAWAKVVGTNSFEGAATFTVTPNALYLPLDSLSTTFTKYDLNTGADTALFVQPFIGYTTSIAVDVAGSIYLSGNCVDGDMNFRGHTVTGGGKYLVKYRANGDFAWCYTSAVNGCLGSDINLADNNGIYYSGAILYADSLGPFAIHYPSFAHDNFVARIDTGGTVQWVTQLSDTSSGWAYVDNPRHAVSMADGSLSMYTWSRGYVDWGNGVVTNEGSQANPCIVNYAPSGIVNWVKDIKTSHALMGNIATNGHEIWVTGNATDAVSYQIDTISVHVQPGASTPYMAMLRTSPFATSVGAVPTKQTFTVFPVPATNSLSVVVPSGIDGSVRVKLSDVAGKLVYEDIIAANAGTIQIPVAKFHRGLYFISISSTSGTSVQKVVLE